MVYLRRSKNRGYADFRWLKSFHTFSFGEYFDSQHMGFGPLRVINEDWVAPSQGFPMHPHKNMEIFTYVVEGAIQHKDSIGNSQIAHAGEIQKMSAGTGVVHSEFNPSDKETLHLYQIWIEPNIKGVQPSYDHISIINKLKINEMALILQPRQTTEDENSRPPLLSDASVVGIEQDAFIYAAKFDKTTQKYSHKKVDPSRHYWVQVIEGDLEVNGTKVSTGDGLGLSQVDQIKFDVSQSAHILFFDMV